MEKDFIIDQVNWHTQKLRNYQFNDDIIYQYFKTIINYLQEKGLTKETIISNIVNIEEDTCIRSSDITEEGMLLIKKAYSKWVGFVVDNDNPNDVTILDKALKKIRNK